MYVIYFVCYSRLWKEIGSKRLPAGRSPERYPTTGLTGPENQNLAPLVEPTVIVPQILK
jgi:hypothetical protein